MTHISYMWYFDILWSFQWELKRYKFKKNMKINIKIPHFEFAIKIVSKLNLLLHITIGCWDVIQHNILQKHFSNNFKQNKR